MEYKSSTSYGLECCYGAFMCEKPKEPDTECVNYTRSETLSIERKLSKWKKLSL